ncbi:MAG: hypothetical protein RMZ41_006705 [Nostoc sp. DedVER02]|uniref:hypothetical protein n=1 Tax=unclassified Nostoc TaxID=2593658 RepID=UPI002AD2AE46|nr:MULTISPECIES: hypothetical protein [unclassified Nostoc]MDZ7985952.1 hypothetical protein [Nostoc sp. DedVER02]MDZ8111489.1 hypothetical protein [Nostoc sp. DedVER01b]
MHNLHNLAKHIHQPTHKFFASVSSIHPNSVQPLYLISRIMNSFEDSEMLKMFPEIPEPILLTQIFAKLTSLGRIHPVSTGVEPS